MDEFQRSYDCNSSKNRNTQRRILLVNGISQHQGINCCKEILIRLLFTLPQIPLITQSLSSITNLRLMRMRKYTIPQKVQTIGLEARDFRILEQFHGYMKRSLLLLKRMELVLKFSVLCFQHVSVHIMKKIFPEVMNIS